MLHTEQPSNLTHKMLPPALFWAIAGAATLCALIIIERMLSGLPVNLKQLTPLALLGALGGGLFGRSEIRHRLLNNRLQESEKRLQDLYRNTPAMLHSLDVNGRLVHVSQAWLDSLGARGRGLLVPHRRSGLVLLHHTGGAPSLERRSLRQRTGLAGAADLLRLSLRRRL